MPLASHRRLAALSPFIIAAALPLLAEEPWDLPPFTSEPKALLAAAEKIEPGEKGVVTLLDEETFEFDAEGHTTTTTRFVFRVLEESAVDENADVSASWSPWYSERPVIAARVVTKNGTVHMLDAAAIAEAAGEDDPDIFSDRRLLHAPLPAVEVGAVVEYTITIKGRSPIPGAGASSIFFFGAWVPTHSSRLIIAGPAGVEPRIVNKTDVKPVIEEKDGIRRMVFEKGRLEPHDDRNESYVPFDDSAWSYVAYATGASWQHIATQYAEIVDRQIAGSELQKIVRGAIGNATDRREIVTRLLAAVQKDVRYAGVEVAEGSIIPRKPSTVLKNKYGDCKDKATLLVAMLRAAGLPAHVVLLRSGSDLDVTEALPGLGRFNHAIVRVGGDDPIWIDPTDEFARAGELPIEDQGRMALVASAETTALTRTPELPSTASRYSETRVFTLPEDGKAHVVEISESYGPYDASQRRWIAGSDAKALRESLEGYVKAYYFAKALDKFDTSDTHDLSKPFRLTLDATESGSGIVDGGDAAVAMRPSGLLDGLPEVLYDWTEPSPEDDPKKAHKPRVHDFVFPAPRVKEWTYRIIPPVGYEARPLPKSETRKLGTTTYTAEYSMEPNGTVVAKLRLDTGKRRLTAAEFEETRLALSKLRDEPQTDIGFDLIGQKKLNEGDVGGALAEFRKLVALHPKEAQHHIEIARALLAGGLGESAREEARRAVAIDPKNARAHAALADVLQHDLFGRQFRKGADIPAAIAALRKAKELDPKNLANRVQLARLLTYGDDGVRFVGTNVRLAEAVDEFRAIAKDFGGEEAHEYDGELMLILAHSRRFSEVKDLAETTTKVASRDVGRLLSAVMLEGLAAGQRELASYALDKRRTYAAEVAQHFMALRQYAESAAMFEIATQGAPTASEAGQLIEMLKKARRIEELSVPDDDPQGLVTRMFAAVAKNDKEAAIKLFTPDLHERMRKEAEEDESEDVFGRAARGENGVSVAAMMDVAMAMMQVQKDGSDEKGYRLRLHAPVGDDTEFALFAVRENDRYQLRATADNESMGMAALHFLEANQPEQARTWLNWAREEVELGGGEDPLTGSPFAAVWPKSKPSATAEEIRLAAQLQMAEHTDETAAKLEELRASASDTAKAAIDQALAAVYTKERKWPQVIEPARRLTEKYPDSAKAFEWLTTALSFTGKTAEVETLAKARLERLPHDRAALRALSQNAAAARDYAGAERYAYQVIGESAPERDDFNRAAWYGIFTGNLELALANARQATTLDKKDKETAPAYHTLAVVFAESGKTLEARQALFNSIDQRSADEPNGDDWYVLGRIAEAYGVKDAAIAAYKRVWDRGTPGANVKELATRRMAGLK